MPHYRSVLPPLENIMRTFGLSALIFSVLAFNAYATPYLGSAGSFAVLGASTVTNTGATTLDGDLGVYPGTALTGTGTVTLTGTIHAADATAQTAQVDALTAYNNLAGLSPNTVLTGDDLGNVGTLGAGTYFFASSAELTGGLTLNFAGVQNEDIVFQIGSTLTTASGSTVTIENAASGDNVYWQVGSSATLGTSTSFMGDIIALTSVTMDTSAKDACGSVIALNAAVTMDNNTISTTCSVADSSGTTIGTFGSGGTTTPTTVTGASGSGGTVTPTPVTGGTTVPVSEGGSSLLYLFFLVVPLGAMRALYRRKTV
jgi:hypothetical protein